MSLLNLADKYMTDKGTNFFDKIPGEGHMYAPVYDALLSHLKESNINLLEIGIAKGASLCMWREYFSNATIVGLDITLEHIDKSRPLGVEGGGWPTDGNLYIRQGSQTDSSALDKLFDEFTNFDIVIDDGSHRNDHQQFTFNYIWSKLKKGSYYILEDIHVEKCDDKSTLRYIQKIMANESESFECEFINLLYTNSTSITCIIKK
jgi:cephalosporin hydroxylase